MSVVIPDEILKAANLTEQELQLEIAILLYKQGRLSMSRAAQFVQLTRIEFQTKLGERCVPVNYDVDDLNEDVSTLKELNRI